MVGTTSNNLGLKKYALDRYYNVVTLIIIKKYNIINTIMPGERQFPLIPILRDTTYLCK